MEILAWVLVVPIVYGAVRSIEVRISRSDRQLARVERKLDLVLEHLGLQEHDPRLGEVIELLRSGKKLHAIKRYRELTGEGLKEAKEAVERLG
ncbi:ribosomal protein L7/L12 [Streptomyces oryzae]|uniref:Ribosomal protein L7/L12 n=1 Tax=Streptomyces oryzae TaxID=1434886 RepID=A0ABS3XFD9_9ACTN|nr:ribosomal protein L7/L12 [Streptomyces oryzae]MBO8194113.1 ribosomal protein L7/L12 [Streptomyces oryzae]